MCCQLSEGRLVAQGVKGKKLVCQVLSLLPWTLSQAVASVLYTMPSISIKL